MHRLLFRVLCAVAAISLSGVHCGVAQIWAWSTMLVERSAEGDFATAVQSTFDGDHPCALCRQVQNQRQKDEEQPMRKVLKEFKPLIGGLCEASSALREPDRPRLIVFPQVAFSPIEGVRDVVLPPPECCQCSLV